MRIVHILNHTRRLNGHVHAAVDLACAQAKLAHQVSVISGGGDFDALLQSKGVRTILVDQSRNPQSIAKALFALYGHARQLQPAVIHAHMMTSAVVAFPICRLLGIPLVTTVHNSFENSAKWMRLGTEVIAVSSDVATAMERRGVPQSKLSVVLNGTIGSCRLEGRQERPALLDSPSIVFVGGLHPRKGVTDLLRAFEGVHRRHPIARLYIVGDGPCRPDYEALAGQLACAAAVHFVGAIGDPHPYMLAADIFVLPSHADPAPLVLSEAREAGCAVVATSVDGIPEMLEHGAAGILVPPRDPSALEHALCDLLQSPGEIALWKSRSQLRIDRMTIDRVESETMRVYLKAATTAR